MPTQDNNNDIFERIINDNRNTPVTQKNDEHSNQTPQQNNNRAQVAEQGVDINDIYTVEEQRNVNNIFVTVPDKTAPTVIFFGSPSSGKTVALLRMHKWLTQQGYTVFAEPVFRPRTDKHYAKMCQKLPILANSNYTPGATDAISFMLVKVLDPRNHICCQILEAPGEHYYNPKDPTAQFPLYIQNIINLPNRKIWVFFVEQDWGDDQNDRDRYAQKICDMQNIMNPSDRVVFLFNKCDIQRANGQFRNNRPITELYFRNIKSNYPHIFDRYRRTGFEKILFGEYSFSSVCFSSGTFCLSGTYDENGKPLESWTRGGDDDWYCQQLWNALMK